jgi:formylmethanofuran dehydrogenase subunit A
MDKEERDRALSELPRFALERSGAAGLDREYSLAEIAIMTRAAPARLLGLFDRGHLACGARADVAIYDDMNDRTAMFSTARTVLKDGEVIVRDGRVQRWRRGRALSLAPTFDPGIQRRADDYLNERFGAGLDSFSVPASAFGERREFGIEPCRT